jgi:SagB-type dehydrogenase family enzyme
MKNNMLRLKLIISLLFLCGLCSAPVFGQDFPGIDLPDPQMNGGRPLLEVLKERKSTRDYRSDPIPIQHLSNLLWASFGINRPSSGKRTAPSAMNRMEFSVYVALKTGLYLYDAENHVLQPVVPSDLRAMSGTQTYVGDAPLNLIYVADFSRMATMALEKKNFYAAADAGFIAQNVYLYCASEGLATVVRGSIDREKLAKAMKLGPQQRIILAQTVGYAQE